MPAPTTANTIPVTLHAQQAFESAAADIDGIATAVLDSTTELTTAGMIDDAGRKWGGAAVMWCDKVGDIRNTLMWMADQLGATATQMQQNEANNVDLASGLSVATEPGTFAPNFDPAAPPAIPQ
jgi:hypothetical protein